MAFITTKQCAVCPGCGKEVRLNMGGRFDSHGCVGDKRHHGDAVPRWVATGYFTSQEVTDALWSQQWIADLPDAEQKVAALVRHLELHSEITNVMGQPEPDWPDSDPGCEELEEQ